MKKMSNEMNVIVAVAGFCIAASGVVAPVWAGSDEMPENYEAQATSYIKDRLSNPRGSRVRVVGEPYEAEADFDGYEDEAVWAVDVRVRSKLPGGGSSGTARYTVIFVDGEPVALEEDDIALASIEE